MIHSFETWWMALTTIEQVFWGISIVSSVLFSLQLIMTLIGLDSDLDLDMDDMDGGFSIISLRTIIAFLLFFGWSGVGCLSNGLSPSKTLMIAFLVGFLAMIAVAYIFAQILKLQETGNVLIAGAISQSGEAYTPIPGAMDGQGLIQLSLEGKVMEFDAITREAKIATGTKVVVVNVLPGNVMLVKTI